MRNRKLIIGMGIGCAILAAMIIALFRPPQPRKQEHIELPQESVSQQEMVETIEKPTPVDVPEDAGGHPVQMVSGTNIPRQSEAEILDRFDRLVQREQRLGITVERAEPLMAKPSAISSTSGGDKSVAD